MADFNLSRFIEAQNQGVYESALTELKNGKKVGHWMWFIFPQIKGLGHSSTSVYYGILNELFNVRKLCCLCAVLLKRYLAIPITSNYCRLSPFLSKPLAKVEFSQKLSKNTIRAREIKRHLRYFSMQKHNKSLVWDAVPLRVTRPTA
jgi:hypothetical protein